MRREQVVEWDPHLPESKEAIRRNQTIKTNHSTTPSKLATTFAASSATEAEEEIAKLGKHPDGSVPVKVPKRIWRPQVQSRYEEPEDIPDTSGDLDWLFQDNGKVILEDKTALEPREDIIKYDPKLHQKELEENLQWRDCPEEHKKAIREVIEQQWDVFCQDGMQRPIRGFEFNIDTGKVKPICAKPPRYGPHEQRVITLLIDQLQDKGNVEDDDGPWGSQIVLASKPSQGHVHWSQYVFRLCVSYRKLNEVTRPFSFPVMRCDDAAEKAGEAEYFITMDLDAGYWQVNMRASARAKTAFYTPRGKKRFRSMPMGTKNSHPAFVAMVTSFEDKWDKLYHQTYHQREQTQGSGKKNRKDKHKKAKEEKEGIDEDLDMVDNWKRQREETNRLVNTPKPGSAVIVDDIILFAKTAAILLTYFKCVIEILKQYRVTVKLRKTRFLPKRAEFVGVDIMKEGNAPAESKYDAIEKLTRPTLFSDLRMLTGLLGFYRA
jgi:hypothetical protein